jgi:hypothetical protein
LFLPLLKQKRPAIDTAPAIRRQSGKPGVELKNFLNGPDSTACKKESECRSTNTAARPVREEQPDLDAIPAAAEESSSPAAAGRRNWPADVTFSSPKSEERRIESLADDSALAGLDENDPQRMARLMRKMGPASAEGEDAEMLDRMASGEMPPDDKGGGAL